MLGPIALLRRSTAAAELLASMTANTNSSCRDEVLVPLFHTALSTQGGSGVDVAVTMLAKSCRLPTAINVLSTIVCLSQTATLFYDEACENKAFVDLGNKLIWKDRRFDPSSVSGTIGEPSDGQALYEFVSILRRHAPVATAMAAVRHAIVCWLLTW
jgi:hypothetical protein